MVDEIYGVRATSQIVGATLHYTASPTNISAARVAEIQLTLDAAPGTKFPGLAYTYIVDGQGVPHMAYDLNVRTWHSAAFGRNTTYVGVCYIGDQQPSPVQLVGLRTCLRHIEWQLGRPLQTIEGHKDEYATQCPGPAWPTWRAAVLP